MTRPPNDRPYRPHAWLCSLADAAVWLMASERSHTHTHTYTHTDTHNWSIKRYVRRSSRHRPSRVEITGDKAAHFVLVLFGWLIRVELTCNTSVYYAIMCWNKACAPHDSNMLRSFGHNSTRKLMTWTCYGISETIRQVKCTVLTSCVCLRVRSTC